MYITKLQELLNNTFNTLELLKEQYGISHKRHPKYPNLIQFKYNQIESPMHEQIVQESRGIILDSENNWEIVAYPFNKFFNYGEPNAAQIDWKTARVQEKLDGSLLFLWNYKGEWNVSTTGTPDAGGIVNGWEFTFSGLFWKVWDELGLVTDWMNPDYTYMFELMTPYNRVVVCHKSNSIELINLRNNITGKEHPFRPYAEELIPQGVPLKVVDYPLKSMEEIQETFKKMNPVEHEGYVIVDDNFNRIKVKHPGYVALHQLKASLSPRLLLNLVRSNEGDEYLTYFPEWKDSYNLIKEKYEALVKELEEDYVRLKDIEIQKDFALEALKTRYSGALFALRRSKTPSIKSFLGEVSLDHLADVLEIKTGLL